MSRPSGADNRRLYQRNRYAPIKAANSATRAERERIVLTRFAEGVSTETIARQIGKNVKTVQRILQANGVRLNRGRRRRRGKAAAAHDGPVLLFGPNWIRGKRKTAT